MSKLEITNFDIAQYLDDKEVIAEYLSQILADSDMDELLEALGNIAKAKGMSQLAKDTGLGRESLYKTFQKGTKLKFETIKKILDSFGVKIQILA
ncbi:putative addiction module antidote protein [Aliarcobacter butzleri]|uniref:addiction module antidote protein n=1 Tax=Aliarcobacter butzleri TaxID=28197 RepID=UPI00263C6A62|nr:addiction module antidote protein [Aliarcobacter butzleri]MDN5077414.1 putative addiction module antidote protein [Aliarcobacter butzleri]MDN5118530.1 putative addiction module antidote protein [Aliarcobacter butzleri]